MTFSWSARRQLIYYGVAFIIVLILATWGYEAFFTAAPTCFDNKQDGTELGVDCGGPCSLLCTAQTGPLVVNWARAFEVSPGNYTAAAYVTNPNVTAGARSVSYSFQLFDASNSLVVERDGIIDLPPVQTIPIVETNISAGNRTIAHALFAFGTTPVWNKASVPALQITGQNLAQDATRLSATLVNNTLQSVSQITVDAVLFDASGTARAASKSIVNVGAKGSVPVVFTWPTAISGIVRAEITVLPPF
jgi:hypothetical protein